VIWGGLIWLRIGASLGSYQDIDGWIILRDLKKIRYGDMGWIRPANCTVMTGISRDVNTCVMTVKVMLHENALENLARRPV
jgi:hypothetical protein